MPIFSPKIFFEPRGAAQFCQFWFPVADVNASQHGAAQEERAAGRDEAATSRSQEDYEKESSRSEGYENPQQWRSSHSSRGRGAVSLRGSQRTQAESFAFQSCPQQQQPAGSSSFCRDVGTSSNMTFGNAKAQDVAMSELQTTCSQESSRNPMATVRPKTKGPRTKSAKPATNTRQQDFGDSQSQVSGSDIGSLDEVSAEMSQMLQQMGLLTKPKPIRRPDTGGIIGTPVKLLTNHFPVDIRANPAQSCYQYDVEISPMPPVKKLSANLKRKILKQFLRQNLQLGEKEQAFAYDGDKKAYSPHGIEIIEKSEIEFGEENEKKMKVSISIKIVGNKVDMSLLSDYARKIHDNEKPKQVLDVCNTMYKAMLLGVGDFVTLKRAVFSRKFGQEVDLGGGLDLWFGYQPSFVMGSWKVFLQIDLTSKPFTKNMPLIKFAEDFLKKRLQTNSCINDSDREELSKALSGYKIKLQHKDGNKRIADIVKENSSEKRFKNATGKIVNIVEYYQTTYHIDVKYRKLPLVRIDPKNKDNCFPMEICTVVGEQQWLRKLDRRQQDLMVRNTAMTPSERSQMIVKMVNQDTKPNNSEFFKNFNVSIDPRMPSINGRVLPGPPVYGARGNTVRSENGKYFDRNLGFVQPARSLQGYVIACPKSLEYSIRPLHDAMLRQARVINWPQNGPMHCYKFEDFRNEEILFRQIGSDYKSFKSFNLVVIILWENNDRNDVTYSTAKCIFDNEFKLPSQVLLRKTIDPPKPQNISNILKKLNTKLGGSNIETFREYLDNVQRELNYGERLRDVVTQYKDIFREPLMVLGADVTHPDSKDPGKPSIAAVVGSLNSTLTRYAAQVMVQRSREEMISGLEEMFTKILKEFNRVSKGQKPQRILYYRDGVSEGQFTDILIKELYAMQSACKKLNPNFTPKITFIVVNKRHKARFFKPVYNRPVINTDPG